MRSSISTLGEMQSAPGPVLSVVACMAALLAIAALSSPSAQAAGPAPAWSVQSLAAPTAFSSDGEGGRDSYQLFVTNSGGEQSDGSTISITDRLPGGLTVDSLSVEAAGDPAGAGPGACEVAVADLVSTVSCTLEGQAAIVLPGQQLLVQIGVDVPRSIKGPLINRVVVEGGGVLSPTSIESRNQAGEGETHAGLSEFHNSPNGIDGRSAVGAGTVPYQYVTTFAVATEPSLAGSLAPVRPIGGDLKRIELVFPRGLIVSPTATRRCTAQQFATLHAGPGGVGLVNECPDEAAVGVVDVEQLEGSPTLSNQTALYSLVPEKGLPAQFGFQILAVPSYVDIKLAADDDYRAVAYLENLSEVQRATAARVTIWGTPGDASHDRLRGVCAQIGGSCPVVSEPEPFLRLPTSCAGPLSSMFSFATWPQPGISIAGSDTAPALEGCGLLGFSPTIETASTTKVADAPTGLSVDIHSPQESGIDGQGTASLNDAAVALPEGLAINPAGADGLVGCSPSQVGLATAPGETPARFTAVPAACPDAARIGSIEVDTPALDQPLSGSIYLAEPDDNPFASLMAAYLVISDIQTGIVVKLAGQIEADPVAGQLTLRIDEIPELPFEDIRLNFFPGPRAILTTPLSCGTYVSSSALTSSGGAEGASASPVATFAINVPPGGSEVCPTSEASAPNRFGFSAGARVPEAGVFSPFVFNLSRDDGSQRLSSVSAVLPAGVTGRLAGVSVCSDVEVPSCPVSSKVGKVDVLAGAGPTPLHLAGDVFLAGAYKSAPLSLAVVVPAQAGPLDLGDVVVRIGLYVDAKTAQVRAVSDPLPQILRGVPLDIRSVSLDLDRPGFIRNPTSCEPMSITGSVASSAGQSAPLSQRFQVGDCATLPFKPKLSLHLAGGLRRNGHPAVRAALRTDPNGAAPASAEFSLPAGELLDLRHLGGLCRPAVAADQCPRSSRLGSLRINTPFLDEPLEGLVYLRVPRHRLPEFSAEVRSGQLSFIVDGRTTEANGRFGVKLESIPDIPLTEAVLSLPGGRHGLIVNSRSLCGGQNDGRASFSAHNGARRRVRVPVRVGGCR
jgi:hypothetical protein